MITNNDAASYFLTLDKEKKYFNTDALVSRDGRTFYEGNARLNKMMHLAQNIYIAMTGTRLIDTDFYAYDNGAVDPDIQENYARLVVSKRNNTSSIPDDIKIYLRKIFVVFKDAPIDELIDIDHEDPEWLRKHNGYRKSEQKMDSLAFANDYKKRYKDMIKVMNRMGEC